MAAVPAEQDFPPEEDEEAPLPAQFSEDNLARHWVLQNGANWRYVTQWAQWYKWHLDRWIPERTAECFELARNITRQALWWDGITDPQRLKVNSAKTAAALLQFVKSDRKIAATSDQWDTHTELLGIPGGVVDLNICKAIPAVREQFITKQTAVAPTKGDPVRWLQFLERATDGNKDIQAYLKRFAGYCLTGETSEHALAFLYGTGANGKTTFVQTLLGVLGDYAITTPIETFSETRTERHPTELARLRGARLVVTEETSTGGRWNESRIKQLTGGNRIAARYMRCDDFEYQPEFKLLIAGNHKPQMRSVDEAMKRRMHIVPFTVTIPEEERDQKLLKTLEVEWPQILNWMIEGCYEWRTARLAPPEEVRDATDLYLQSEDVLAEWIEECCERDGNSPDSKPLYECFKRWMETNSDTPWKKKTWTSAMIDKGFKPTRTSRSRGLLGISLKNDVSFGAQQHHNKSMPYADDDR